MYVLTVKTKFAAAHRLRNYAGECENLHGHNWKVTARVGSPSLNEEEMVVDFREVKDVLEEAVDKLDHHYLNDSPPFDEINPTTENLAAFLARHLAEGLPENISVRSVTCWESDDCGATYVPDEHADTSGREEG